MSVAQSASVRYHYMDNLRAIAMMAGIFFHAALAYSPLLSNLWMTADPSTSIALDAVAWFSHLFRMPLFFVIAGFFSSYLIERRGLAGFLKNRGRRILLPLVLFLPLLWLSYVLIIGWAVEAVEHPSPIMSFIRESMKLPEPPPPPPPTTTHLWFLYNLLQFYVVFAVLHRSGLLAHKWVSSLASARFVVFVLPILMIPALAVLHTPHPAPEQFVPQLWSFGFFGLFFVVGSQLYHRPEALDGLKPYVPWILVTSVGLYAVLYQLFPEPVTLDQATKAAGGAELSGRQLLIGGLEAFIAVHMTVVCLAGGKALLDRANSADSFYRGLIVLGLHHSSAGLVGGAGLLARRRLGGRAGVSYLIVRNPRGRARHIRGLRALDTDRLAPQRAQAPGS